MLRFQKRIQRRRTYSIQIWYTAGFMHQKVILIDSACAAVGTANLDNRSFRLNFEITILNYDPKFIKEVEDMLTDDFSRSRTVTMEDYTRKSFFF